MGSPASSIDIGASGADAALIALLAYLPTTQVRQLANVLGLVPPAGAGELPLRLANEDAADATSTEDAADATSTDDPVLAHLAHAVLSALAGPSLASPLLIAHLMSAIRLHLSQLGAQLPHRQRERSAGGLSPHLERRAKALLAAPDVPSIAAIAEACGMSRSHFSRMFKLGTGMAPQAWQLRARLQRAEALLAEGQGPIAVIANRCGFADQSHLTRAFKRHFGITPAQWRRSQRR